MDHALAFALTREHIRDLVRAADNSRAAADLPDRHRHRTPRRRPPWWRWATVRAAGA
jgi:hypothetical protein